jgi:hypothetical protein
VLLAAVPPGYSGSPGQSSYSDDTAEVPLPPGRVLVDVTAWVRVSADGGDGALWALLANDGRPAPDGDLCAADVAARLDERPDARCEVLVVDGVAIRVTTERDDHGNEMRCAARFLWGGFLAVTAQGAWASGLGVDASPPQWSEKHPSPLAAVPLSSRQLAEIAANPAMLP